MGVCTRLGSSLLGHTNEETVSLKLRIHVVDISMVVDITQSYDMLSLLHYVFLLEVAH